MLGLQYIYNKVVKINKEKNHNKVPIKKEEEEEEEEEQSQQRKVFKSPLLN